MKLLADLHTHSKNSRFGHGKNSIEEMAIEANEVGLVEIGITDHGYAHFFRTSKNKLKEARKIIDEINEWSKTKVLLGVEADIISEDGTLDIDNETLAMLDILVVGYHRMIFTDFAGFFGKTKNTAEARQKCTNAFINAINKYPVTIVSHLDSVLTTDLYEIGKVCRERGTLVEINNRHTKWSEKQMDDLIASGCLFVVSSDAHARKQVGVVDRALEYIKKYNIPSERVANIEFSEEEKSERDKAFTVYQSMYDQLESTKKKKEETEQNMISREGGNLSDEMERELKKIANEKGFDYHPVKRDVVVEQDEKSLFDENLIGQAENYIKEDKFNSFREENESVDLDDDLDDVQFSFDDDHPLVKDEFADKFQSINSVIKQSQDAAESQSIDAEDYKSNNLGDASLSAYEQLSSSNLNREDMQSLKNLMTGSTSNGRITIEKNDSNYLNKEQNTKSENGNTQKKIAPEDFMGSITQTGLSKQSKPLESAGETKTSAKPLSNTKKTNRRGGAFIVMDNLIGDDKK